MRARSYVIAGLVLGILAALSPRSVEAGQLKVSPVRLHLGAANPVSLVRISNPGDQAVLLHLRLQHWGHPQGADRYVDTQDVLLNPMIFRLEPGEDQLVRIGMTRLMDNKRELAYRLFIREVPEGKATAKRRISTYLNISLPLFVAPKEPDGPLLVWRLEQESVSKAVLEVENRGNLHAEVSSIALQRQSGEAFASIDRRTYVLSGESRRWELPGNALAGDEWFTLTAASGGEPVQSVLRPGAAGSVEEALR
jgi:fimbrial chaperone protein